MKLHIICLFAAAVVSMTLAGCKKEDLSKHSFENKVFVEASKKPVMTYLKKGAPTELTRTLRAGMADPMDQEVLLTYMPAPQLVATYNAAYYDKAVILPAEFYELTEPQARIAPGSVISTEAAVLFKQLDQLDRDGIYVLPVTLLSATNIEVLERSRTTYYVFRGAALINVVANLTNNHLDVKWVKPSVVNNLSQVTLEALVNVKKFDRTISTVMGIEEHFLLRLGDAGRSANMVQLSTKGGNLPSQQNDAVNIPANEWVHIAATYDATDGGTAQIYINGVLKASGKINDGNLINLGVYTPAGESEDPRGFHIGYSYDLQRYMDGDIAEVRIWNRVLSAEEIASPDHFYYVDPISEGLVCYWKFDDGAGDQVKDYSVNANNATAVKVLTWNPVELPPMPK